MLALENLVLDAIETDLLAPSVVNAAIEQAIEIMLTPEVDTTRQAARELAELDQEIARLTNLAAAGAADIPAVLEGLRTRQGRQAGFLFDSTRRSPHQRARGQSRREIEASLREQFSDWRSMLRSNVIDARPVIETVLAGRISVKPQADATKFDVRIPLTMNRFFEGICGPQGGTSPAGFEPALPP